MSGPEFLTIADRKYPEFAEKVPVVLMTACTPPSGTRVLGAIDKMADYDSYLDSVRSFLKERAHGQNHERSYH